MGTIFAPIYANLSMGYHEIKVYSIIRQSYTLASKHFENSWFRYLDDCQILLKINLIKPEHFLPILNQMNINIQFTMVKTQTRLPFLDIMIKKVVQKSGLIFTTNQQTQNDMSHLRQTTHGIVWQIYRSLLQEEYVSLLKMKM